MVGWDLHNVVPDKIGQRPDRDALSWDNEHRFLG
jgi:hypothetical protein